MFSYQNKISHFRKKQSFQYITGLSRAIQWHLNLSQKALSMGTFMNINEEIFHAFFLFAANVNGQEKTLLPLNINIESTHETKILIPPNLEVGLI